jgi:hypothetical protein
VGVCAGVRARKDADSIAGKGEESDHRCGRSSVPDTPWWGLGEQTSWIEATAIPRTCAVITRFIAGQLARYYDFDVVPSSAERADHEQLAWVKMAPDVVRAE